jgi:molecular chaperone GrpE (heat shock protein)
LSDIKEQFKTYINNIIDGMEENEIEEIFHRLTNPSKDEILVDELVAIKGELKKVTKTFLSIKEQQSSLSLKKEYKNLIEFHQFLTNSKDSLDSLPDISHFNLSKFKNSFAQFRQGFSDIDLLYENLLEVFELQTTAQIGAIFDENLHEAVEKEFHINLQDGEILEIFRQGYYYQNSVIVYAKVKINRI